MGVKVGGMIGEADGRGGEREGMAPGGRREERWQADCEISQADRIAQGSNVV